MDAETNDKQIVLDLVQCRRLEFLFKATVLALASGKTFWSGGWSKRFELKACFPDSMPITNNLLQHYDDEQGFCRDLRCQLLVIGGEAMRKLLIFSLAGLSLAGCTPTQQGAGIGAATGAVVGGAVTNNVRGAAVGAAIGGASGAVIGNVAGRPGQCEFRDRNGRRYIAACPR